MLTSGIYFEAGGTSRPSPGEWASYFAAMQGVFAAHSVEPGYYIIDSLFGEGRFKQYGTSVFEARLSKGFSDVDVVALAATPSGIKEPGYNWNSLCNLTYIEGYGRLSLALMIDEQRCPFGGELFRASLGSVDEVDSQRG